MNPSCTKIDSEFMSSQADVELCWLCWRPSGCANTVKCQHHQFSSEFVQMHSATGLVMRNVPPHM